MYINTRIKNYIKYITATVIFVCGFILNINTLFAADITYSTGTSYRVGDTIHAKIVVSSDTSVNAVSANISFPADKLSITSISKAGSIISLWAKEPAFSNVSGAAILEGIILNGFTGNGGNVVTVNFRAKSEGQAELGFINASVLANDGNGTAVPLTKTNVSISILKALPVEPKKVEEKPITNIAEPIKEAVVEVAKDTVEKVITVEEKNNLPKYSLVIPLLIVVIILLIFIIIYGIYFTKNLWLVFKKKISKTSNDVLGSLEVLKKDLNDEIIVADKIRRNETLDSNDVSFQIKLEKDINIAEEKIVKEIKQLEVKE